jgi:O-antigen biosynthesis protein WbqP
MTSSLVLRLADVLLASFGLIILWPLLLLLYILGLLDTGKPLLRQKRVGRMQRPFYLIKFRSMRLDTPEVGTHLVTNRSITPLGAVLRRTKVDELPQLWNVLCGDMSLVGPRPCLPVQHELIRAREIYGVHLVRPGITGLAQVNRIDMSTPDLLAETDARMLRQFTLNNYFKYIFWTIIGKGGGDRVIKRETF